MSFRFKKATALAAGTFNIYIVQPPFLIQMGLMKEGAFVEMQADFVRPGFRFRVTESPYWWNIKPDRLFLDSESSKIDCGEPLAIVLDALHWTPIMGIGSNLEFEAEPEIINQLKCKLPECEVLEGFAPGQKTWHVGMVRSPQTFNLQVSSTPPRKDPEGSTSSAKVALSINVHTEIAKGKTQLEANKLATAACRQFASHRDEAVQIARKFLGVEIVL